MKRIISASVCLVMLAACSNETAPPAAAASTPVAQQAPPEPVHPTIDTPIDSTPEPVREALLQEAINKVAAEYQAEWMLQPTQGSTHLFGQISAIYGQNKPGLTFYALVKRAFQNTREDFLNRAEVARTSAEILYRAQAEAAQERALSRVLRQRQQLAQQRAAAEQAAFNAQLQSQMQAEADYANAVRSQQYAQQQAGQQAQRQMPTNASRFDPENVGFDSRRGYTSPKYNSGRRSSDDTAAQVQTGPRRFQDQTGRWYEQQPGSAFARDERTGKQCFVNGAFVNCN